MVKKEKEVLGAVESRTNWKPALAPALALIAIGVVPGMLKGLYAPYVGSLMAAYVASGLLFISLVLVGLGVMVFRDLSARKTKIFRLAPSEQPARGEETLVRVRSREDRTQ